MRIEELNSNGNPCTTEITHNLWRLREAMTQVERAYGQFLHVTSGLRSWPQHEQIYRDINARRIVPLHVPLRSNHLVGLAVDVFDPTAAVWDWVKENLSVMERLELYLEDRRGPWVHFQLVRPRSGNRIFQP